MFPTGQDMGKAGMAAGRGLARSDWPESQFPSKKERAQELAQLLRRRPAWGMVGGSRNLILLSDQHRPALPPLLSARASPVRQQFAIGGVGTAPDVRSTLECAGSSEVARIQVSAYHLFLRYDLRGEAWAPPYSNFLILFQCPHWKDFRAGHFMWVQCFGGCLNTPQLRAHFVSTGTVPRESSQACFRALKVAGACAAKGLGNQPPRRQRLSPRSTEAGGVAWSPVRRPDAGLAGPMSSPGTIYSPRDLIHYIRSTAAIVITGNTRLAISCP